MAFSKKKLFKKYAKKSSGRMAGEAIASGGFGCVFNPALRCRGTNKRTKGVSKLLYNYNADKEYNEFIKLRPILETIPNNQKYFLITDITRCRPNKLEESDKDKFDSKCMNLHDSDITEANINHNLDKVKIINLPFGGEELHHTINNISSPDVFLQINNKLIHLLVHAIIPINKLKLMHNDIKDSNILYSADDGELRLIDWGTSAISTAKNAIPKIIVHRPFQYNLPFSLIILNSKFDKFYKKSLSKPRDNIAPSIFELKNIILNYVLSNEITKTGHFEYVNTNIIPLIFTGEIESHYVSSPNYVKNYSLFENIIADHIVPILLKYTNFKKRKLMYKDFFTEVYINNVDIWGLIIIYVEFLLDYNVDTLKKIFSSSDSENLYKFQNSIQLIIYNYLYSANYSDKPIDTNKLIHDLKNLNRIFGKKQVAFRSPGRDSIIEYTKFKKSGKPRTTVKKTKTLEKIINKQLDVFDINDFDKVLSKSKSRTKKSRSPLNVISVEKKVKRCKAGYWRIPPKHGECISKDQINPKTRKPIGQKTRKSSSPLQHSPTKKNNKRCGVGYRRIPPKIGNCIPKGQIPIKTRKSKRPKSPSNSPILEENEENDDTPVLEENEENDDSPILEDNENSPILEDNEFE